MRSAFWGEDEDTGWPAKARAPRKRLPRAARVRRSTHQTVQARPRQKVTARPVMEIARTIGLGSTPLFQVMEIELQ